MRWRPDVLVIGAGVAGAAAAAFLARAGHAVSLVEAVRPGFGASGRNPGFLWLQTKTAGPQVALALAGRRFQEALVREIGDFGFRPSGGLIVYRDESIEPVARAFVADRRGAGLPVELIGRRQVHHLCPALGDSVCGAVWNPLDAHQDTRRLVARLIGDATVRGAAVREGVAARRLVIKSGRCLGLELATGERITAGATVLAAGPGSLGLLEGTGFALPTVLYTFEAAETAPAPFTLGPVVCGQALLRFFDPSAAVPRHAIEAADPALGFTEQAAQYGDGRIQFGCAFRTGTAADRPTPAGQALAREVLPLSLPGLAALPVERTWAGTVLQTQDGMPIAGAAPGVEGLWLDLGHFFGNLAGALCGRLVADLLSATAPIVEPGLVAAARAGLTALGDP